MDSIIIYKLLATPAAILICILLSKKWGAFVGGLFGGLPTLSGPISFFLTLEQGPDFAVVASYNSLLGLIACSATAVLYPWIAVAGGKWWLALSGALLGYFALGYALHFLPHSYLIVIPLACLSSSIVTVCLPKLPVQQYSTARPRWILVFQLLWGSAMVYGVSELAETMGPEWSGTIMCFPIMICALAPFAHANNGVYAALMVIKGLLTGWIGTAVFSCTVIVLVHGHHIAVVYLCATCSALFVSILCSLAMRCFRNKSVTSS